MPTFSFHSDGIYNLKYGVFNSTGDPYSDLIESNNLNTIVITINTELDIQINSMYPSHNPIDSNYLYGENMLTGEISNEGNKTLFNLTITMTVNSNQNQQLDESTCYIGELAPSQSISCLFDIMVQGNNLNLKLSAPTSLNNLMDINPNNNEIIENTDVLISQINVYTIIENQKNWYTDNENITINGKEYLTEHFNIKSNDESLSDEKKFEFDVWYNPENNLILKVTYNKMGNWEYRLRSFE